MEAASASFLISEKVGAQSVNTTCAPIAGVFGSLRTTVTLLRNGDEQVCLITPHVVTHTHRLYRGFQRLVRREIGLSEDRVLVMGSHNHTTCRLSDEVQGANWGMASRSGPPPLTDTGKRYFDKLGRTLRKLPRKMQPVKISWAVGREGRISYNRKGRRADGSTYFMREEDRFKVGRDFRGDIDEEAPVVCLKNLDGTINTFITHFNAHPVTAYHPEHCYIFGEYPQVAGEMLANHYRRRNPNLEVAFVQGCAGDINSKGMFSCNVAMARRFGRMLGRTYIEASKKLRRSKSEDLSLTRTVAEVPCRRLPGLKALKKELADINDFIRRGDQGDEDTRSCVGMNFPKRLNPPFRAATVRIVRRWSQWAIRMHESGRLDQVPRHLEMEVCVLRLGDVAIIGLPGEPFIGIGRQIRAGSPAPLTIPCGYTNVSYGYVPDGQNVGDREYMSAFYRYTKWPPYRKPGGDVLARCAVKELKKRFRNVHR